MQSWTQAESMSRYRVTVGGRAVPNAVQVQFVSNDEPRKINGFNIPPDVAARLGHALLLAADGRERMEIIGWQEREASPETT